MEKVKVWRGNAAEGWKKRQGPLTRLPGLPRDAEALGGRAKTTNVRDHGVAGHLTAVERQEKGRSIVATEAVKRKAITETENQVTRGNIQRKKVN